MSPWMLALSLAHGATLTEDVRLTASDATEDDQFGFSVSAAGDVNGDGYDDVIVGAWRNGDDGFFSGSAYVFHGSATGVRVETETKLTASDAQASDYFGWSVSAAGDVNGDGYDDVIVGAYEVGSIGGAYVYLGGPDGIDLSTELALGVPFGTDVNEFGWSVSGVGDLDADGYDDVVVGAKGNALFAGAVFVYRGSATGIDVGTEQRINASDGAARDDFGTHVSGAGDLDGDGYDDLIVGSFDATVTTNAPGAAYVYYGSATGVKPASEQKLTPTDGVSEDAFGVSVSGAGDLNADGFDDLVIGAWHSDALAGSAYVYYGSANGVLDSSESRLTAPDGTANDLFGGSVCGAGDVDGDGFDDVVVGAQWHDDGATNAGAAYVFAGGPSDQSLTDGIVELNAAETQAHTYLARSVSRAGDVNGDGADDLIIGAHRSSEFGAYSGSAVIFLGVCAVEPCLSEETVTETTDTTADTGMAGRLPPEDELDAGTGPEPWPAMFCAVGGSGGCGWLGALLLAGLGVRRRR